MIVVMCDNCQKIILDADLRSESSKKQLCSDCLQNKKGTKASLVCDRCDKKVTADALRKGEALVVAGRNGKKGKIYCNRCRSHGERASREILDLKYLIATFIFFLGVPLTVGLFVTFKGFAQKSNVVSPTNNSDIKQLQDDLNDLKTLIENSKSQQSSKTTGNIEDLVEQITRAKTPVPTEKTKVKEEVPQNSKTLSFTSMISEIEKKATETYHQDYESGNTAQKISALSEIIRNKELAGIPLLMKAVNDPDPFVKSLAAKGLGALGAKDSVNLLLTSVSKNSDPLVRKSLTQSLRILTGEPFVYFKDLSREELERMREMIDHSIENPKK